MTLLKKRLSKDITSSSSRSSSPQANKKIKASGTAAAAASSTAAAAPYASDEMIYTRLMDCMARKHLHELQEKQLREHFKMGYIQNNHRQFDRPTSPPRLQRMTSASSASSFGVGVGVGVGGAASGYAAAGGAGRGRGSVVVHPSIVTPQDNGNGASSNHHRGRGEGIPSVSTLPSLPFEKKKNNKISPMCVHKPSIAALPTEHQRVNKPLFKSQQQQAAMNPLDMLSSVSSHIAQQQKQQQPSRSATAASAAVAALKRRPASPPKQQQQHQQPRHERATPSPSFTPSYASIVQAARLSARSTSNGSHTSSSSTKKTDPQDSNYVGERSPTGQRHGRGIMAYANGCRYVGLFHNDKRHGYGKCWYPQGLGVYSGHWKDNKKCGKGSMTYANGDIYEGTWSNDLPNGKGTLKMTNGDVYEGEFVNQKKNGRGKYTFVKHGTQFVYSGMWEEDVKHGEGVLLDGRSGKVLERKVYYRGRDVMASCLTMQRR